MKMNKKNAKCTLTGPKAARETRINKTDKESDKGSGYKVSEGLMQLTLQPPSHPAYRTNTHLS